MVKEEYEVDNLIKVLRHNNLGLSSDVGLKILNVVFNLYLI